jgi:predicted nucleic acid-binding protein
MRFVDTSFWVAYRFRRDDHHSDAVALWADRSQPFLTTDLVVGETWTFLRRRIGHSEAVGFLDNVEASSRLSVQHVDASAAEAALAWLRRHDERDYSFVDATSFEVMRRERIAEALAFDGDFAAAGFVELRPAAGGPDRRRRR